MTDALTLHPATKLLDALCACIERDIHPLSAAAVAAGSKLFGAAILLKSDLSVVYADTNQERGSPLWHGETWTLKQFFEIPADAVIAMLADDAASRAAWTDDEGALAGVHRGAVLVESSTLSVGWVKELAAQAESQGCKLLDAPVTGSKPQAENGELLFLVGGDAGALDTVRDVLKPMSRGAVHLGPSGSGALMKLINNFLCGVQAASLAEALAMIENSGLDRTQALEVLANGAPGSPMLKTLSARMTSRDFRPNFSVNLMAKDLTYAIAEGSHLDVALKTAQAGRDVFQAARDGGWGEQDISAIIESFRHARKG